uniref:Uncharacterized protein n=1 Tax=Panagrellus redivivus TaxID=6233 RepID=A0A7E4W7H1_PANRE
MDNDILGHSRNTRRRGSDPRNDSASETGNNRVCSGENSAATSGCAEPTGWFVVFPQDTTGEQAEIREKANSLLGGSAVKANHQPADRGSSPSSKFAHAEEGERDGWNEEALGDCVFAQAYHYYLADGGDGCSLRSSSLSGRLSPSQAPPRRSSGTKRVNPLRQSGVSGRA